jgi:hypothetical protein
LRPGFVDTSRAGTSAAPNEDLDAELEDLQCQQGTVNDGDEDYEEPPSRPSVNASIEVATVPVSITPQAATSEPVPAVACVFFCFYLRLLTFHPVRYLRRFLLIHQLLRYSRRACVYYDLSSTRFQPLPALTLSWLRPSIWVHLKPPRMALLPAASQRLSSSSLLHLLSHQTSGPVPARHSMMTLAKQRSARRQSKTLLAPRYPISRQTHRCMRLCLMLAIS